MNDTQNLTDIAPELAQKAIDLRAEYGYNCAQAVACALADAVAADSASLYAYTRDSAPAWADTPKPAGQSRAQS